MIALWILGIFILVVIALYIRAMLKEDTAPLIKLLISSFMIPFIITLIHTWAETP